MPTDEQDQTVFVVTDEQFSEITQILERPAQVNERLAKLLEKNRQYRWRVHNPDRPPRIPAKEP